MKIYAGNLPEEYTLEELEGMFAAFGEVLMVEPVVDQLTGRMRNYAFVHMPRPRQGKKAVAALNGVEFKGRNLSVSAVPED